MTTAKKNQQIAAAFACTCGCRKSASPKRRLVIVDVAAPKAVSVLPVAKPSAPKLTIVTAADVRRQERMAAVVAKRELAEYVARLTAHLPKVARPKVDWSAVGRKSNATRLARLAAAAKRAA